MPLHIAQTSTYVETDWWRWSVWLEGPEEELEQVKKVVYVLHRTFPNPVQEISNRASQFRLDSAGWGIFTIFARVHRHDGTVIKLEHPLKLWYPDGRLAQV